MNLQSLLEKTEYLSQKNRKLLTKAFDFAEQAHEGQQLRSGQKYIQHPLAVAHLLADLHVGGVALCAALLHDIPYHTSISLDYIRQHFGTEIAMLVEGVDSLHKIRYREDMTDSQIDMMRKIAIAMTKDMRIFAIKLASRLELMRSGEYVSRQARIRIARETLEIYAVLADVLGIWNLRWQLEEISFQFLEPEEYEKIRSRFEGSRKVHDVYMEKISRTIQKEARKRNISCQIAGRSKHFYSIYQKIREKQKEFDEIYDALGLRIIVSDIQECYAMLGVVHSLFTPMPGRVKDYIGSPKENGYRSIHTTVFGPEQHPFEIQIRTSQMDREAMHGVAAHWSYKKRSSGFSISDWIRDILRLRTRQEDAAMPWATQLDVLGNRVFVFSPKKDIIELPKHATPLDFAYIIHSGLGHSAVGAIVNHHEVGLDYELHTGDTINIIRGPHESPDRQWLSFVKTKDAKEAISSWLSGNSEQSKIRQGRLKLQKELGRYIGDAVHERSNDILKSFKNYPDISSIYDDLAEKKVSSLDILRSTFEAEQLLYSSSRAGFKAGKKNGTEFLTSVVIRTRSEKNIINRIYQTIGNFPIHIIRAEKILDSSINRVQFIFTCQIKKFQILYEMCGRLEMIPEVESVTKQ